MHKIKDILQLHHDARLSNRAIAQVVNVGYGTVADDLKRTQQVGLVCLSQKLYLRIESAL
ncbi:hypothetical protein AB835_07950 [Candidatus Endobugula sertula]|uniref:Helix-turn-helix type 11 domain-containing protein n=1 Tax=Candidatus Endobugula sertula TaxID=62101 RepID=A0A1D2QPX6_9GAMM|nr:hypothetical protein AB835_07950 [Candidatus Endobugula sertula]